MSVSQSTQDSSVEVKDEAYSGEMMKLTRQDRCDACSAAAAGWAELSSGGLLLFCAHHLKAHEEKLKEQGAEVWWVEFADA